MAYTSHYSVLKKECLEYLTENNVEDETKLFADLTFGGGGHTFALSEIPNAKVYSTDQDPDALANGYKNIKDAGKDEVISLLDMNFSMFPDYVENELSKNDSFIGFDGILMDLGVSSHHFDSAERGFSFRFNGPLDMRMNPRDNESENAADLVNSLEEEELAEIFWKYGEERLSRRIAAAIIEARASSRIETTKQLEDIIFHCYPKKSRFSKTHPATRSFQALRLVVNDELGVLERSLPKLFNTLRPGGRLAVISFHSLEDRIVKWTFKELKNTNASAKILTKKPVIPSETELSENPRSRSAKLRVIEKLDI